MYRHSIQDAPIQVIIKIVFKLETRRVYFKFSLHKRHSGRWDTDR